MRFSPLSLALAFSVLFGCQSRFYAGRCDQTSDCPSGQICNTDPTPQGNGRCVSPDGGGGDGGGEGGPSDGGDSGPDAQTCPTVACPSTVPVCLQGACVECAASSDCNSDPGKPICDTTAHTCGPCTSDSQCANAGPGICMAHLNGHCATDAETVYVQNTTGCMPTYTTNQQGGTAAMPYCSMEPVGNAALPPHNLVVIRGTVSGPSWTYQRGNGQPETSFIGQQGATIASSTSPGLNMDSGTVYVRGVKFTSSAATGITASGGTLALDAVTVDTCQGGGILLSGAAFDIQKTNVTNNGPGQDGTSFWGGIFVKALPAGGSAHLDLVTVQGNKQIGINCSGQIQGDGVLASGNAGGVDVSGTCGITTCSPMSATCGAP